MKREYALNVVLVLVGLLFVATIYPLVMTLRHPIPSDDTGDTMMMSLYFTLGVFLLLAVRSPALYRNIIAFAAWSSFAHAIVMTTLGVQRPNERADFLGGSAVLVVIGTALLALGPRNHSAQPVSTSGI